MSSGSSAKPFASGKTSFTPAMILLGLAFVINYVDRGNLSMAGAIVQRELKLSSAQLGFLFSAFFYTYMAMQFVIGRVVDRFGANPVLTAGLLVWSLATVATGFVGGFIGPLALRLLLCIRESVAFSCASKLIAPNARPRNPGLANAVITPGVNVGPAIGAFGAGMVIAKYGWRMVFLWMGISSLFWIPP